MKEIKQGAWIGTADRNHDPKLAELAQREFADESLLDTLSKDDSLNVGSSRRDFLKYLGFGLGAATVAASCEAPVRRAIPYVVKPDEIVPGVATYYASSYVDGGDYCAILVKTREGRPIKIEGNAMSPVTKGGTNARAQATVLSLYDTNRLRGPIAMTDGSPEASTWQAIDKAVAGKLNANAKVRIITNTVLSPTSKSVFNEFKAKYPNTEVVSYDAISAAALLDANEQTFGIRAVPAYSFQNADVIVSFGADFLGTWISPIEYAAQYVEKRKINNIKNAKMSRHIQVESGMSLTGSNADNRILVKPSEQGAAIVTLFNEVGKLTGGAGVSGPKVNDKAARAIAATAKELVAARGKSLVVCGTNNVGEQLLVNQINIMLGNYGKTFDFGHYSHQRQGSDKAVRKLITEMNGGSVDALFVFGGNPAYDLPDASQFVAGMAKVGLSISFAGSIDETGQKCNFIAPDHHLLEAWGDAEPKHGQISLIQPTISPLFNTRKSEVSLLTWAGSEKLKKDADQPYYEYLKNNWESNVFSRQTSYASFQSFWDSSLHDGVVELPIGENTATVMEVNASSAASKVSKPANGAFELGIYETVNMGAGQHANNPWLQELPDPVLRTVWGNYLSVPVEWNGSDAIEGVKGIGRENMYSTADLVDVTLGDGSERMTAVPQFGQMEGTLATGIGYGRTVAGKAGQNTGTNLYPHLSIEDGYTQYYIGNADLSEIVGKEEEFACVQYHHTYGVTGTKTGSEEVINVDEEVLAYQGALTDRSVVYSTNFNHLDDFVHELEEKRAEAQKLNSKTLYPYDEYKENFYDQGHHWGMHIDMNACIGCGACSVACMAENNVPVVGKREVHRHHEMTWLRIDRYYYGDVNNPNVMYQPMLCQHCDNAPCENVCPVAATNHSSEGLNQMTYNRCIGTRYCANNCPYKVRRFNWLDYTTADLFPGNQPTVAGEEIPYGADNLTRMVLNPDVTVRSRGVIEKCSFCVQRIQEGKLTAKREQRALMNNDVKTACQTACPTGAITFGDMNNEKTDVSKKMKNPLVFHSLEEINVLPSIQYQTRVNNRSEALDA